MNKQVILVCDGSINALKQTLRDKKKEDTVFVGNTIAEVLINDDDLLLIQFKLV